MSAYLYTEEKRLLQWMQEGDEAAFTELYNRFWKSLFTLALAKLKDANEAQEIVQDVFCDFWRRREVHHIDGPLSAYFFAAIKYKILNVLAKRALHSRYQQFASRFKQEDHSTENLILFEELKEQLALQMFKLPEKCRLVFQLSREKGFSQKQIASELGISENTVESHLSKALRILRTSLNHFFSLF